MKKTNQKTRREFLCVSAINPKTGKSFVVQIFYDRLHWIKKRGIGAIKEAGFSVIYVLQNPVGVFEGLCWEQDQNRRGDGWLCYCAVPPHDYTENGDEKPPRPNKVFLIFVTTDNIAYNWRWEKVDQENSDYPRDFKSRFRKRLI